MVEKNMTRIKAFACESSHEKGKKCLILEIGFILHG